MVDILIMMKKKLISIDLNEGNGIQNITVVNEVGLFKIINKCNADNDRKQCVKEWISSELNITEQLEDSMLSIDINHNVRGYIGQDGIVYLSSEDIAIGLGWYREQSNIITVRWNTVRQKLEKVIETMKKNNLTNNCQFDFLRDGMGKDSVAEYLPENIFYKLCFMANSEQAIGFQSYVTDIVLPSIRKNGGYIVGQEKVATGEMSDLEFLARANKIAERIIDDVTRERDNLKIENQTQKQIIEEHKPKVKFADAITQSKNSISMGEMAKILKQNGMNTGRTRLFELLRKDGYLGKTGRQKNLPMQSSMNKGLFEIKRSERKDMFGCPVYDYEGNQIIDEVTLVTPKGQKYLINKYIENVNREVGEI